MGVFNPVFRPHGSGIPSEPIFFSAETQDIVREAIKLRYRLMPYIYNAAYENTISGKPIVKPLFYYHVDDEHLKNYSDAYYFGDEIIVAPVINKGVHKKEVYLPKGWWYDFNTSALIKGGQKISVDININTIPVFIKEGSFIPMVPDYRTTDDYPKNELDIHFYPSATSQEAAYTLFEDDGMDAKSIKDQNYQLIKLKGIKSHDTLTVSLLRDSLQYTQKQDGRRLKWIIHQVETMPEKVMINNKKWLVVDSGNDENKWQGVVIYNAVKKQISINMPFDNDRINIQIIQN
jgi:oligosaccharide 4-alpha-D-glucosyltransferase